MGAYVGHEEQTVLTAPFTKHARIIILKLRDGRGMYEGWNFNSGNYLFTTDTK